MRTCSIEPGTRALYRVRPHRTFTDNGSRVQDPLVLMVWCAIVIVLAYNSNNRIYSDFCSTRYILLNVWWSGGWIASVGGGPTYFLQRSQEKTTVRLATHHSRLYPLKKRNMYILHIHYRRSNGSLIQRCRCFSLSFVVVYRTALSLF